jgi:tRNA threonylcarbamoyladenosine biosynthesis protein TsaB
MTTHLLAIDASTDRVEIVLVCVSGTHEASLAGGAQASLQLLPALAELCQRGGCELSQLDAIAYGAGPGAFTGLRTACSVAQGLAFGLDRPTLALETLAVVAESAALQGAPDVLWAALDARMGEVYAAPMQRLASGYWQNLKPSSLYTPQSLLDAMASAAFGSVLAGPAALAYPPLAAGGDRWPLARPGGVALAQVAQAAWLDGKARPAHEALPLYGRDKVAQTSAERLAARVQARPAVPASAALHAPG